MRSRFEGKLNQRDALHDAVYLAPFREDGPEFRALFKIDLYDVLRFFREEIVNGIGLSRLTRAINDEGIVVGAILPIQEIGGDFLFSQKLPLHINQ